MTNGNFPWITIAKLRIGNRRIGSVRWDIRIMADSGTVFIIQVVWSEWLPRRYAAKLLRKAHNKIWKEVNEYLKLTGGSKNVNSN